MSNNENNNRRIITLKQPKDLETSKLVKIATYNMDTEIIDISLNSCINSSIVFSLDKKKWTNNPKTAIEQAIELGIIDKEIHLLLKRLLNENVGNILNPPHQQQHEKNGDDNDEDNGNNKWVPAGSIADVIVALAIENTTLFQDEFGIAYALLEIENHYEVLSIDGTPPDNLSDNDGFSEVPQITSEGNNVYVVWSDTTGTTGDRDIFFTASNNNGQTFSTPPDNLSDNDGESTSPQISSEGNNVYVIWDDSTPGNPEIFFTASNNNGQTFSTPPDNLSDNEGTSAGAQISSSTS